MGTSGITGSVSLFASEDSTEPFVVLSADREEAAVRYPLLGLVGAARKAWKLGPDAALQVVAARRQDTDGRVGSGIGPNDRAVQLTVQHILAADTAAGDPARTVTIPVSNAQVRRAAAVEQAVDGLRWRDEMPTGGQLAAVSCELHDAPNKGQMTVPGYIARAAGAEPDGSPVDVLLTLSGSPLLQCTLVARPPFPVALYSGRSTGFRAMDNLSPLVVVRALVSLYGKQEPQPRLRLSVTGAAAAGGRPAQLQLEGIADSGAPPPMPLQAKQVLRVAALCNQRRNQHWQLEEGGEAVASWGFCRNFLLDEGNKSACVPDSVMQHLGLTAPSTVVLSFGGTRLPPLKLRDLNIKSPGYAQLAMTLATDAAAREILYGAGGSGEDVHLHLRNAGMDEAGAHVLDARACKGGNDIALDPVRLLDTEARRAQWSCGPEPGVVHARLPPVWDTTLTQLRLSDTVCDYLRLGRVEVAASITFTDVPEADPVEVNLAPFRPRNPSHQGALKVGQRHWLRSASALYEAAEPHQPRQLCVTRTSQPGSTPLRLSMSLLAADGQPIPRLHAELKVPARPSGIHRNLLSIVDWEASPPAVYMSLMELRKESPGLTADATCALELPETLGKHSILMALQGSPAEEPLTVQYSRRKTGQAMTTCLQLGADVQDSLFTAAAACAPSELAADSLQLRLVCSKAGGGGGGSGGGGSGDAACNGGVLLSICNSQRVSLDVQPTAAEVRELLPGAAARRSQRMKDQRAEERRAEAAAAMLSGSRTRGSKAVRRGGS